MYIFVRESLEHGWYEPGAGTQPYDVGKLLELHGVGVHSYQHASIFHLAQELAEGHKVMVGVDAKELWEGNSVLAGKKGTELNDGLVQLRVTNREDRRS